MSIYLLGQYKKVTHNMLIGYARTSTLEQKAGLEAQLRDLKDAGCTDKIFKEQVSSVDHREQLEQALDYVRDNDTLVVTRLYKLYASNIVNIIEFYDARITLNMPSLESGESLESMNGLEGTKYHPKLQGAQ